MKGIMIFYYYYFSYVAVAIHDEKEMGGSNMFCYSHNSQTGVGMSWNQNNYPKGSDILDQNDLTNVEIENKDGKMKCSFTRPKYTNVQAVDYDLANKYHILLAKGPLQGIYDSICKYY